MPNEYKVKMEMFAFLKKEIMDKNKEWVSERLMRVYLLFNKAMNLITELGLGSEFYKGMLPELQDELKLITEYLTKAWKIKNNGEAETNG